MNKDSTDILNSNFIEPKEEFEIIQYEEKGNKSYV